MGPRGEGGVTIAPVAAVAAVGSSSTVKVWQYGNGPYAEGSKVAVKTRPRVCVNAGGRVRRLLGRPYNTPNRNIIDM